MFQTSPSTIIIPRWIYQALVRHHIDLSNILNYDTIKEVLSKDDIAEWCYLNDKYTILKHHLSDVTLCNLFNDYTELSSMSYIKERVEQRLAYQSDTKQSKCYETINVNQTVLIILDEGFDCIINKMELTLEFIRDCLKAHSRVMSIAEVSYLPLHSLYIELL